MYIDYSTWETFEYKLTTLKLDINNPRIKYRGESLNQTEILKLLLKEEKVYELAKKISEEGYFVGEEPIICIENDKKIVLEGNRRTAALKLLQDPKKYLSTTKANVLLKNTLKNDFPVNKKLRCYISPNRLLANPIIYERHNGDTLKKWKTGNQYSFIAEIYYEDALRIEDICEVLNETRSNIIKPLKAYNLFFEGKEILEKERDIIIDISNFDLTNLERFYGYTEARKLIGVEFDNENGELIINLPREEFEKRLVVIFEILIDSDRFSRDFNNDDDKKRFVEKLKNHPEFVFTEDVVGGTAISRTSEQKADLEREKTKTTTRRKKRSKRNQYNTKIILKDTEIFFDHDKLDDMFNELKNLPIDKYYSFAILLRSYLEQSLYFYLLKNDLLDSLDIKTNEMRQKYGQKKVDNLVEYIKGVHKIDDAIDTDKFMEILKFNSKTDYSNQTLKIMLDYVKNNELDDHLNATQLRNLKHYIDNIKEGLDLAVHNLETIIDKGHNIKAWKHLKPLFEILSNNISTEN